LEEIWKDKVLVFIPKLVLGLELMEWDKESFDSGDDDDDELYL
jgi:hypothetical protein